MKEMNISVLLGTSAAAVLGMLAALLSGSLLWFLISGAACVTCVIMTVKMMNDHTLSDEPDIPPYTADDRVYYIEHINVNHDLHIDHAVNNRYTHIKTPYGMWPIAQYAMNHHSRHKMELA